jgi:hypothetical protein
MYVKLIMLTRYPFSASNCSSKFFSFFLHAAKNFTHTFHVVKFKVKPTTIIAVNVTQLRKACTASENTCITGVNILLRKSQL